MVATPKLITPKAPVKPVKPVTPAEPAKPGALDVAMLGLGAAGTVGALGATAGNLRESAEQKRQAKGGSFGSPLLQVAEDIAKMSEAAPPGLSTAAAATVPRLAASAPKTTTEAASQPVRTAEAVPHSGGFWNRTGDAVMSTMPAATAVLTIGGAALTVKGVYDAVRAEKDRKRMLEQADEDRTGANARENEFHGARMRLLGSAMRPHSASLPAAAPLLGGVVHDPVTGLSMDPGTAKVSEFDPRLPLPPRPHVKMTAPSGPGLMDGIETIVGAPSQAATGPYGVNFAHPVSPVLRI